MERIRKFERYCLRAALHIYRNEHNKFFISNSKIYDAANVSRIDLHILKLVRDFLANLRAIDNSFLHSYSHTPNYEIFANSVTEYIYPHSFTYFDSSNIIQNYENIPLTYHTSRHQAHKKSHIDQTTPPPPPPPPILKYSTTIPNGDFCDTYNRFSQKYWWVSSDPRKVDEIRITETRKDES